MAIITKCYTDIALELARQDSPEVTCESEALEALLAERGDMRAEIAGLRRALEMSESVAADMSASIARVKKILPAVIGNMLTEIALAAEPRYPVTAGQRVRMRSMIGEIVELAFASDHDRT